MVVGETTFRIAAVSDTRLGLGRLAGVLALAFPVDSVAHPERGRAGWLVNVNLALLPAFLCSHGRLLPSWLLLETTGKTST